MHALHEEGHPALPPYGQLLSPAREPAEEILVVQHAEAPFLCVLQESHPGGSKQEITADAFVLDSLKPS